MEWNIAAESISLVILCIIWVYSKKSHLFLTLKNRVFQICLGITFCAIASNILSTICIAEYRSIPMFLTWFVTAVYFTTTPLMGILYYNYTLAVIYEQNSNVLKIMALSSIPALAYILIVFANFFTHSLFSIDVVNGYIRGPHIDLTYCIFYLYCFASVLLVMLKGRELEISKRRILFTFPILAFLVIVVQQIFVSVTLSGSAATCALLILYLYLQNKQISVDYATGLFNRLEFSTMIDYKMNRQSDAVFSVIVLSLRNFKQLNRQFGEKYGDICLQEISRYLTEVTNDCKLYRFSGDEFAIYMEGQDRRAVGELVRMLRKRMTEPWRIKDISKVIPVAIGVIKYPLADGYETGVIEGVEFAVARAKKEPVKNVCFCTGKMFDELKRREQVVEILKQKIKDNDVELFLQPILSVEKWRFLGAEALLRMNNTPLGALYPSEFIPIAEETGLIIEMTYQILDKACSIVKKIMDKGIEFYGISVNFSNVQFAEENLAQKVFKVIEKHGIPFSKIKIEITESMLSAGTEKITSFANTMKEKGILIYLDDFGTGYSNLNSVFNTPIDILKLDKSLLWSAMESKRTADSVKNLTWTFQEMGLRVLVEGVETVAQSQFVVDCGCTYLQGYLYAKPMTVADAEKVLGTDPGGRIYRDNNKGVQASAPSFLDKQAE